ncbi:MAG TPA: hypothetical protein VJT54_02375 [Verrucomicrobiae bacterium]|nr:hypothetical protein [Verrucomicrobiae bacterium]
MKTAKKVGIVLLVVVTANLAFILFVHRRTVIYQKEWFNMLMQDVDETMKSNGMVKVGSNTWELPNTNRIPSVTNKPISN